MTIKPVITSPAPQYPDKYGDEIRRVLKSARPRRWIGAPLVAGLLTATVAFGASGCAATSDILAPFRALFGEPEYITSGDVQQIPTYPEYITMGEETLMPTYPEYVTMGTPMPTYAMPIPVFEFGEGTGAIGCMSVSAPVFMSEEEALAIISAVFAENGLTVNTQVPSPEKANIPVTDTYDFQGKIDRYETIIGELLPDGLIDEGCVPFTFVSAMDVDNWQGKGSTEVWMSVSVYETKKTALTLAENNPGHVVFYDPIVESDYARTMSLVREDGESDESYNKRWIEASQAEVEATRAESERLLRQQVEAYIAWRGGGG